MFIATAFVLLTQQVTQEVISFHFSPPLLQSHHFNYYHYHHHHHHRPQLLQHQQIQKYTPRFQTFSNFITSLSSSSSNNNNNHEYDQQNNRLRKSKLFYYKPSYMSSSNTNNQTNQTILGPSTSTALQQQQQQQVKSSPSSSSSSIIDSPPYTDTDTDIEHIETESNQKSMHDIQEAQQEDEFCYINPQNVEVVCSSSDYDESKQSFLKYQDDTISHDDDNIHDTNNDQDGRRSGDNDNSKGGNDTVKNVRIFEEDEDNGDDDGNNRNDNTSIGESADNFPFVDMLRHSVPYISNHRNTLVVYHISGDLIEWDGFPSLMDDIALTKLLGMNIVIVAGCRHQVNSRLNHLSQQQQQQQQQEQQQDGEEEEEEQQEQYTTYGNSGTLRVTNQQIMRIVEEEAGYVRFEVERQLNRCLKYHSGGDATTTKPGASTLNANVVSGNFYEAKRLGVINGIDYGYAGAPTLVKAKKIKEAHSHNDVVLLTSCGISPQGESLNVKSESLAAHVAATIGASKVIYCVSHPMTLRDVKTNKSIQNFRLQDAKNILARYQIQMSPTTFIPTMKSTEAESDTVTDTPSSSSPSSSYSDATFSYIHTNTNLPPGLSSTSLDFLFTIGWASLALEYGVERAHIISSKTDGALVTELFTAKDGTATCISQDNVDEIHPDEYFGDAEALY